MNLKDKKNTISVVLWPQKPEDWPIVKQSGLKP